MNAGGFRRNRESPTFVLSPIQLNHKLVNLLLLNHTEFLDIVGGGVEKIINLLNYILI